MLIETLLTGKNVEALVPKFVVRRLEEHKEIQMKEEKPESVMFKPKPVDITLYLDVVLKTNEHIEKSLQKIAEVKPNSNERIGLSIKAPWSKIIDADLIRVSQAIKPLAPIIFLLSIDLQGCHKITDDGVSQLFEAFSTSTSIESLTLDIGRCDSKKPLAGATTTNLGDSSCDAIDKLLSVSSSLTYVDLSFGGCDWITPTGFEKIVTTITTKHPSLQCISIGLARCQSLKDTRWKVFKTFSSLSNLKLLNLSFGWLLNFFDVT
eukprot:TRINITY_DN9424_c0_g2_i2.p1 TRINITY_DN9424_c0_g2~~TRINITY_DN9424_c0_g2_i2.p1  ORF type:complete len:264 (+),score=17.49 TRINITY_DN9424_c0_g2_i2:112-903(+)